VLDFFGGMFQIRGGKAIVPGGVRTEKVWAELTGVGSDKGAAFIEKLMAKDDGWLASYFDALARINFQPRLPSFAIAGISWSDLVLGLVFLALPQVPLTLGNAIIAITEENNRLFPHRPVSERSVSISTGLMNVFAAAIGGVPMCHGAGGMAGHVRFGARTGGALIILGGILILLGLFFSGSVDAIFRVVPREILGVILFLTGAQLALGSCDFSKDKGERFTTIITAGLAMWNIGLAFAVGLVAFHLIKRDWIRL